MATVLVADDQSSSREATARVLREAGHHVILAVDGKEALEKAAAERPDLVILDVVMPRMGGLEACRALKRAGGTLDFLPVVFVSSRADVGSRIEGLGAGAEDFLGKPYDPEELRARVAGLLRTKRIVDEALRGRVQLEETALHDPLTGLYNQRYLMQRLDEEFRRAQRYNEPLSVMAIDLDEFEQVNGRFGRATGDKLLGAAARTLAATCREVDIVTRSGGDEFVVVLPNTHFAGSITIAERIWSAVRAAGPEEAAEARCGVSIGVACYPNREVATAGELLKTATTALARAKGEGRGKICLFQHQVYLFQPEQR